MGHLTPTGGNISARAADDDKIWITPSQLYKGSLTADSLLCITADGAIVAGRGQAVGRVPDALAVATARGRRRPRRCTPTRRTSTAFGITNQKFPPINTDAIFLADTQIVPWFMPGSKELADAVAEALKVSRGAILQCHGLMAVGKTMRDAATRAMMLEETAKLVLYCKQFGGELTLIPDGVGRAPGGVRQLPLSRAQRPRRKNDAAIAQPTAMTKARTALAGMRRATCALSHEPAIWPAVSTAASGQSTVPRMTK